jgi:hypothetical protein
MKRVTLAVMIAALGALSLAASAQATFSIKGFDVTYTNQAGNSVTQAGSHPFAMTSTIDFSTKEVNGKVLNDGSTKDLTVQLPPGLIGDRDAVPHCPNADFLNVYAGNDFSDCTNETVVGVLRVRTPGEPSGGGDRGPAFNLNAPPGYAAKIGFILLHVPVALLIRVNPAYPHNLIATVKNTADIEPIGGVSLTLWGVPAAKAHDKERGKCLVGGECPVTSIPVRPFITLPRSCEGPLFTTYAANSWEEPGHVLTGTSTSALETDGCEAPELELKPQIAAHPTTEQAESPSGLDFNLDIEDEGLTDPAGVAQSDMKKTVVTLPAGMTINPAAATGLSACSPADLARESVNSQPGEGCPEASKLGSAEVETKLLAGEVIKGNVYIASQDDPATTQPGAENPFDSLLAIYLVIQDPDLGISVKLAGRVQTDPVTGQLTTTFGELGQEIPQFPVSHLRFHFRSASPPPLVTPPACGQFTTDVQITPWANPAAPLGVSSSFPISSGPGGGPCPAATLPFKPGFTASSTDNTAGAYSPFYLRLTRNDGEQEITRLDSVLPPGLVGKIAGLAKCPEAAIAAAKAKSGRQELAAPSCPVASRIGRTLGGAGVGPQLTYVPGSIYLAGPFGGDPLSIVAITPAVAGPFDVGTVVVRQALSLDPVTGEVLIDGAKSDPIPHILKGIPLRVRDLRVYVDRPNFTINPTGCEPKLTKAAIFGSFTNPFSPADDVPAAVASPYRATNCAALKFKPKLSLSLKGGTRRSDHPALKSLLTYPKGPGYANVAKAVVTLPSSEFIDNAHIQNPCTRVQFAAKDCPKGSILGTAKAITPLLDEPLEGPVYFRSNGGERLLPDVVADLNGLFHVVLVGKVDSVKGRIRTTFDQVPDAPVSKFTLSLKGGKKGLLVNSRNLCVNALRADLELTAQNGRVQTSRPIVKNSCGGGKKDQAKHPRHRHRR